MKAKLKEQRNQRIVEAFKSNEDANHPKGETLSDASRLFRIKVVSTLLKAGIPLNKVDTLRKLLEEGEGIV